ncbi:indole-3-glycerol phosphate synthase [Trametes meyenii]|nr:indole-3-glycerol phosphate synthase [Trametes meyenii]
MSSTTAAATKPPTILQKIYAQRQKDVEAAKATPGTRPEELDAYLEMGLAPPLIPLIPRLKRNPSTSTAYPSLSLMAEIKRASPSKGDIAPHAGASVISVLTEPTWFKGNLLDMRLARAAVDALPDRPAVLRKEFVFTEYQIAEARLWGADTVLLIVAMLAPEQLRRLYAYALGLGMESLVEVNNAQEMERALEVGAKVIGVNNRNLHDFSVDMGTTSGLVDMVRERDVVLCALSGIQGPSDVKVYKEQGVNAVLVGESLMRATDTKAFIKDLLAWPDV